jgi:AcrR family transcriptional regulator
LSDQHTEDRRVSRTRQAIVQALMDLVGEYEYDAITVAQIIERADVGRSTFYQHFNNKDDALRALTEGAFLALTDAVSGGKHSTHVEDWMEIFFDNRRGTRALLSGQTRAFVSRELAGRIEARLERIAALAPRKPHCATRLAAAMIAESQLGLMHAWLAGQAAGTAADIATALRASARAPAWAISAA